MDGIKVLFGDKDKALDSIGRMLGAFDDRLRVDLKGKVASLQLTTSDPQEAARAYEQQRRLHFRFDFRLWSSPILLPFVRVFLFVLFPLLVDFGEGLHLGRVARAPEHDASPLDEGLVVHFGKRRELLAILSDGR